MAPCKTKSVNKVCSKCSVVVKNDLICCKCTKSYHPSCLLKIPGAHVGENGEIYCCFKFNLACNCQSKDDEIQSLKKRLLRLNERMLENSLADDNSVMNNETKETENVSMSDGDDFEASVSDDFKTTTLGCSNELKNLLTAQSEEIRALTITTSGILDHLKTITNVNNHGEFEKVAPPRMTGRTSINGNQNQHLSYVPERSSSRSIHRKPRILILGDSQSRQGTSLLKDYIKDNYCVETVTKPGATFDAVTSGLDSMTRTFTKRYFVIIVAGTNDILAKHKFDRNVVKRVQSDLKHTNCILVTVPFFNVKRHLNNDVHCFNSDLYKSVCSFNTDNFKLIDINDIVLYSDVSRGSIHLTLAEKRRLYFHIATSFFNFSFDLTSSADCKNGCDLISDNSSTNKQSIAGCHDSNLSSNIPEDFLNVKTANKLI